MRLAFTFTALALTVSLNLASLHAAPEPGKETVRKEHTLPKDKEAAVITLDFKGNDFIPGRIGDKPTMTILADGTVKIPPSSRARSRMTRRSRFPSCRTCLISPLKGRSSSSTTRRSFRRS